MHWLVGPLALAAFSLGQLLCDVALQLGFSSAGHSVKSIADIPPIILALRLPIGHLVGGIMALVAVGATLPGTARQREKELVVFGSSSLSALLLLLFIAPLFTLLAADGDSLLQHLAPDSAAKRATYRQLFFPTSDVARAITLLGTVLFAPLFEELVFRGALLRRLSARYGNVIAIFISALLFAVAHRNLRSGVLFFGLGVASALIALRSGGVFLSVCAHALYNLTFYVAPKWATLPPAPSWSEQTKTPFFLLFVALLSAPPLIWLLARELRKLKNSQENAAQYSE